MELSGNLAPLMNPSQGLSTFRINFHAFRENRLPFAVKVKGEPFENVTGDLRVSYRMKSELAGNAGESPAAICTMTARIPDFVGVVRPTFEANLSQAVSTGQCENFFILPFHVQIIIKEELQMQSKHKTFVLKASCIHVFVLIL